MKKKTVQEIDASIIYPAVGLLKLISERYAPNVEHGWAQFHKVEEEMRELTHSMHFDQDDETAIECVDLIIAAVRLGTMLSDDFAQVILDKCKELNEREPLK